VTILAAISFLFCLFAVYLLGYVAGWFAHARQTMKEKYRDRNNWSCRHF